MKTKTTKGKKLTGTKTQTKTDGKSSTQTFKVAFIAKPRIERPQLKCRWARIQNPDPVPADAKRYVELALTHNQLYALIDELRYQATFIHVPSESMDNVLYTAKLYLG